ncbi:hypothetical protein [Geopseudomonas aromaticivorans]
MTVIARFVPQQYGEREKYIDSHRTAEPAEFDVTAQIDAMPREQALAIRDDQESSDALRNHPSVPEWIREWGEPFRIEVETAIADHFDALDAELAPSPAPCM